MMAGQIHEPFSFNFQADSIHSGSVSFGRFANEPLLWERRSTFSHNRILEEVERCSKHRIVTEKKAYFEAHFRKKALLRQCSLDERHGTQYETSEKDNRDLQFVQGNKDNASFNSSVNGGNSEDYDYAHADETSDASNDIEEREMIDYHVESREIHALDCLTYPSSDDLEAKAKVNASIGRPVEQQTVIDCTYSRCNSAEHDIEVEQNIDEECKTIVLGATSPKAEKEPDTLSGHTDRYPVIMAATESRTTEPSVKVTSTTRRQRLSEAATKPSRNVLQMGKQNAQETKTFKQSKINLSSADKWCISPNPKHPLTQSLTSVSKSSSGSKSMETRLVKATKSHVMTMAKGPLTRHQTPNSAEKVAAQNNSGSKISLTSVERAEKREDTVTRMERMSLARKSEITRNSARSQEKTAAETKLIRRRSILNARPMPSPCNEADRLALKSKDAVANRAQKIPSITGTKVVPSSHLKSESGPSKSLYQVSYHGKNPTKTSQVSSLTKRSLLPTSMRNAARAKEMADGSKDEKSKKLTVSRNAEAIKGSMGNIVTSLTLNTTTRKAARNVSTSSQSTLKISTTPTR